MAPNDDPCPFCGTDHRDPITVDADGNVSGGGLTVCLDSIAGTMAVGARLGVVS